MSMPTRKKLLFCAGLALVACNGYSADDPDASYAFVVQCSILEPEGWIHYESFVAETADPAIATHVRQIIAGTAPYRLGVFEISAGAGGIMTENRNYHAQGQPAWSWRTVDIVELMDISNIFLIDYPRYVSVPSEIEQDPAAWIAANGQQYAPLSGRFLMELDREESPSRLINVSNRGVCGTGERVLIAGFVVRGSTPQRVLIRGRGPSLSKFGVSDVALDPELRLHADGSLIAINNDWQENQSMVPFLGLESWLTAGLDPLESALVVTLSPGAYTVHLNSANEGIGLIEVFDLENP